MKQITKERILKALLNSSRYGNSKPETHIVNTRAKVGLNPAIGNAIRNNHDPFTERNRIILALIGLISLEQIVNFEDQELDLAGGQILGNGGSFELAQALRKADNESM